MTNLCEIRIVLNKELKEDDYAFELSADPSNDFSLMIYTNGKSTFDEMVGRKDIINQIIEESKDMLEHISGIKCNVNTIDDILNNLTLISFSASKYRMEEIFNYTETEDYSPEESKNIVYDYLMSHPEYKDKKIVINDAIKIDTDLEEVKNRYIGFKDLYVIPEGDSSPMPIDNAKVGNELNDFINNLKSLNLSPLEYSILVYDLVREKPYKYEEEGESKSESREVYRALVGDSIVCAGYANIYSKILNELGIYATDITLESNVPGNPGHARNLVYIKDDKYNIDAAFVCDPTVDSREKEDTYDYLYNYIGFLKKDLSDLNKVNQLHEKSLAGFDYYSIDEIDDMIKEASKPSFFIPSLTDDYYKITGCKRTLRNLLYCLTKDEEEMNNEIPSFNKYKEKMHAIWKNNIDATTFVKALINVRMIENRINSNKYPYSLKDIINATPTYRFKMDGERLLNYKTSEEQLFEAVFGKIDLSILNDEEKIKRIKDNYVYELKKYEREINGVSDESMHKVINSLELYKKGYNDVTERGNR